MIWILQKSNNCDLINLSQTATVEIVLIANWIVIYKRMNWFPLWFLFSYSLKNEIKSSDSSLLYYFLLKIQFNVEFQNIDGFKENKRVSSCDKENN
jgi:hypothetical protein